MLDLKPLSPILNSRLEGTASFSRLDIEDRNNVLAKECKRLTRIAFDTKVGFWGGGHFYLFNTLDLAISREFDSAHRLIIDDYENWETAITKVLNGNRLIILNMIPKSDILEHCGSNLDAEDYRIMEVYVPSKDLPRLYPLHHKSLNQEVRVEVEKGKIISKGVIEVMKEPVLELVQEITDMQLKKAKSMLLDIIAMCVQVTKNGQGLSSIDDFVESMDETIRREKARS